ncbi:MAG: F0F1 ATP synthase subunit B [Oscillospiraceae bacterium]|nr:F0F1 ATP synthase subunit B [Oscillospiraceae bacterium]
MEHIILLSGNTVPIFNLEPLTFAITIFNTAFFVMLYRVLLHKKVRIILDKRKEAIKLELDEATLAKEKAEAAEKKYMEMLAKSKAEAEQIITKATAAAREREDEIVKSAEQSATQIRQKAQSDIERERKRTMNEIKDQVAEIVVMAASAVSEKEIDGAAHSTLIESFLANSGETA